MKFSEGLRKGLAIREKLGRPYCAAVIVAAGSSSRMGGTNKILTVLEKLPVICRTVDAFDRCSLIDEIIVVTQKDLMEKVSRYLAAYGKMRMVVAGGEMRTDSVMAGLAAVSDKAQLVAVHDGARPLVTDEVIRAAVVKAKKFAAAAPADGAVARALDLAAGDRVPERDVVRQRQPLLFLDRRRAFAAQHRRQHRPEPVLRVPVEKHRLPRLDRRKRAQDQNPGASVVQRRDRVVDPLHHRAAMSASTASSFVAHEQTKRPASCSSSTWPVISKAKSCRSRSICAWLSTRKTWLVGETAKSR